jgi:hypothetical protein
MTFNAILEIDSYFSSLQQKSFHIYIHMSDSPSFLFFIFSLYLRWSERRGAQDELWLRSFKKNGGKRFVSFY